MVKQILFYTCLLIFQKNVSGQWVEIINDYGITGYDSELISTNDTIIISADTHVFISLDNGTSWEKKGGDSLYIKDLSFIDQNKLIINSENALYVSSNLGDSWDLIPESEGVNFIDFYYFENSFYAITNENEIWSSKNGVDFIVSRFELNKKDYEPTYLFGYENNIFIGTYANIYKSNIQSLNQWEVFGSGLPTWKYGLNSTTTTPVTSMSADNQYMYIVRDRDRGVWRIPHEGGDWELISNIDHDWYYEPDKNNFTSWNATGVASNDTILLATTFDAVNISFDHGNSWCEFDKGIEDGPCCVSQVYIVNGEYYFLYSEKVEKGSYLGVPKIILPNVFTPNGDGINDFFKPVSVEKIEQIGIIIYNRWGNKIAKIDGPEIIWDGGNNMDGIYYYIFTYSTVYGGEKNIKGSFQILK